MSATRRGFALTNDTWVPPYGLLPAIASKMPDPGAKGGLKPTVLGFGC